MTKKIIIAIRLGDRKLNISHIMKWNYGRLNNMLCNQNSE